MPYTKYSSYPSQEGGLRIKRAFPSQDRDYFDPFILLDHFGPQDVPAGSKEGVGNHPHRGFETVTYIIDGELEHNDSKGNRGIIGPGGIQWMTAAHGIIHSEYPSEMLQKNGGTLQGLQLWVNLPNEKKMIAPRYQDISQEKLPIVTKDGYTIRVISGTFDDSQAPTLNYTPVTYYHLELKPNSEFIWKPEVGWTHLAYCIEGEATVGDIHVFQHEIVHAEGEEVVRIKSGQTAASIALLSGKPIGEPIVAYGPFVMTTVGDIKQALLDYQSGKLG